ncbi:MAG TPA: TIGR01777 family oxidoreductase [Polyangiaceae bacterium]|jgi:hypothetical protein
MSARRLALQSEFPVSVSALAGWHAQPSAAERLNPPWLTLETTSRTTNADSAQLAWRVPFGPFRVPVTLTQSYSASPRGATLHEQIAYEPPFGALGGAAMRRRLARVFRYRHELALADLERGAQVGAGRKLRVLVSGATGLVGRQLSLFLEAGGHQVVRLVRRVAEGPAEIRWDPARGEIEQEKLARFDALVHLAGENVASHRWSAAQKRRVEESRVLGTRSLCRALAALTEPPKVAICASAIGFYGETGDETRDEASEGGAGFLADVCRKWEAESQVLAERGVRLVRARIGVVVARKSGAIEKMRLPFSLGLGGRLASGRQYVSWISLDDLVGLLHFSLFDDGLEGALNCVAPQAVTNAEMTRTLARMLARPALLVVPAFALKLLYGEFAEEALKSQRIVPAKALARNFRFRQPALAQALAFELGLDAELASG